MSSHADAALPGPCPNCNAVASGNFCHQCGQETVLHPASTREFLHEFIGHYVALEGKLWGTLARLFFRPGALTNEYIRGRRVRFVQPLRIYLTCSLIFFAVLKFSGMSMVDLGDSKNDKAVPQEVKQMIPAKAVDEIEAKARERARSKAAASTAPAHAGKAEGESENGNEPMTIDGRSVSSWLGDYPYVQHKVEHFEHLSLAEKSQALSAGLLHFLPYAVFCLMPVFAFYLKVLYLGSGRRFGEHLLFALHSNAFAYALLTLMFLPLPGFFKGLMWCWLLGYLPWAMRRVYHKSRFGTFWRWAVLMTLYTFTLALGFLAAASMGVLTGH
ncbi:DUF3667 domain-containing protein [Oxalobacteraceae bacterium A2-2]